MPILGIDEVGLGPWAGPVVVGAVILPEPSPAWVAELRDSKQLSEKKRQSLSAYILAEAITGLGWYWQDEINQTGMRDAPIIAAKRALADLKTKHPNAQFSKIIIDGKRNYLKGTSLARYTETLVKGDDRVKEISAASIIAKVARDNYMVEQSASYPGYDFEHNKGYGTPKHIQGLQALGPCKLHRLCLKPLQRLTGLAQPQPSRPASSFNHSDRQIANRQPVNHQPANHQIANHQITNHQVANRQITDRQISGRQATHSGHLAESKVADFLASRGHTIIAQNYKTRYCEIDLISTHDGIIYFTEVKYRHDATYGDGLAAITPAKKHQMTFASDVFLDNCPEARVLEPRLAIASVSGPDFTIDDYLILAE